MVIEEPRQFAYGLGGTKPKLGEGEGKGEGTG